MKNENANVAHICTDRSKRFSKYYIPDICLCKTNSINSTSYALVQFISRNFGMNTNAVIVDAMVQEIAKTTNQSILSH